MSKMQAERNLARLWLRGTEFLGCKYAILGGAMTWVSDHRLTAAISNAGGFGVLACGAMDAGMLDQAIGSTRALTDKPFGVNLITMHPALDELIAVCGKHKLSHVVLAGGLPSTRSIAALKGHECKVIGFAPALGIARKLVRGGIDALVIEGHEAGGHIGPVSTGVLAQEILPHVHEVPVFVAGGIGRGEAIVSYLKMGAAGCQLGTRFVCADESPAHPLFKQAFIKANAREAVVSPQLDPRFPVIPVRALANAATKSFLDAQARIIAAYDKGEMELREAQLQIEHFWAGSLRRAVMDGDVENGSLMAGQSVGMVEKEQTVQEIIDDLTTQAVAFLEAVTS